MSQIALALELRPIPADRCLFSEPKYALDEGSSPAESQALRSLFQQEAIRRGILTHGNHMLSPAHTEQVIDVVLEAYGDVFAVVADAAVRGDEQDVWRVPRCRY